MADIKISDLPEMEQNGFNRSQDFIIVQQSDGGGTFKMKAGIIFGGAAEGEEFNRVNQQLPVNKTNILGVNSTFLAEINVEIIKLRSTSRISNLNGKIFLHKPANLNYILAGGGPGLIAPTLVQVRGSAHQAVINHDSCAIGKVGTPFDVDGLAYKLSPNKANHSMPALTLRISTTTDSLNVSVASGLPTTTYQRGLEISANVYANIKA